MEGGERKGRRERKGGRGEGGKEERGGGQEGKEREGGRGERVKDRWMDGRVKKVRQREEGGVRGSTYNINYQYVKPYLQYCLPVHI